MTRRSTRINNETVTRPDVSDILSIEGGFIVILEKTKQFCAYKMQRNILPTTDLEWKQIFLQTLNLFYNGSFTVNALITYLTGTAADEVFDFMFNRFRLEFNNFVPQQQQQRQPVPQQQQQRQPVPQQQRQRQPVPQQYQFQRQPAPRYQRNASPTPSEPYEVSFTPVRYEFPDNTFPLDNVESDAGKECKRQQQEGEHRRKQLLYHNKIYEDSCTLLLQTINDSQVRRKRLREGISMMENVYRDKRSKKCVLNYAAFADDVNRAKANAEQPHEKIVPIFLREDDIENLMRRREEEEEERREEQRQRQQEEQQAQEEQETQDEEEEEEEVASGVVN